MVRATLADHLPKCVLAALLGVGIPGCSQPLTVAEVEARVPDLDRYQTYAWITDEPILIGPGTGDPAIRNVATERAIRAAVDRALAGRGLRQVEEGAQLLVSFSLATRLRAQVQGGRTPLEMVADDPATLTRATLTLQLFDAGLDQQIWAATAHQDLEGGDEPTAALTAAVAALTARLPGELPGGEVGAFETPRTSPGRRP